MANRFHALHLAHLLNSGHGWAMPQMRQLIKRTMAIAVGVVAGLLLAEIALRVANLAPTTGVATVTEKQFQRIPGLFAPGQHTTDRRIPALPHVVIIDSLGYRGDEFPRVKAANELRILMVGDSFTYGDFVDNNATLPAQLQERLARACRAPRVVNAGIGGTTIIEHHHMVTRGLALAPDLVILTFSENDVTDLAGESMWDQFAKNRHAKSRPPLSWVYPLLRQTALWNLALQLRGSRRAQATVAAAEKPAAGRHDDTEALRHEYARRLQSLHDSLATHGVPLVIALYPSHHAVTRPDRREQLAWIEQVATRAHIPTVSLLPALLRSQLGVNDLYLLPHDGHPSPKGYGFAADTLAAFVAHVPVVRSRC